MDESKIIFDIPSDLDVKELQLPKNYTLFVHELKRFAFGGTSDTPTHHHTHGMTDEEYNRFVSDMWIGIVLTLLMVFIVFALCFWYMYHKFQQWKRSCKFFFLLLNSMINFFLH